MSENKAGFKPKKSVALSGIACSNTRQGNRFFGLEPGFILGHLTHSLTFG